MDVRLKRIGLGVLALAAVCLVAVFAIDAHVRSSAESRIVTADETARLDGIDCIVVLGCGVRPDGQPSDMLADRIAQGVALYEKGASPKLLMSGDHSRSDYDEVNTMRNVAVEADLRPYAGQEAREVREILARDKDFLTSIVQPLPTFLGDPILLSGSGSATEG